MLSGRVRQNRKVPLGEMTFSRNVLFFYKDGKVTPLEADSRDQRVQTEQKNRSNRHSEGSDGGVRMRMSF